MLRWPGDRDTCVNEALPLSVLSGDSSNILNWGRGTVVCPPSDPGNHAVCSQRLGTAIRSPSHSANRNICSQRLRTAIRLASDSGVTMFAIIVRDRDLSALRSKES
jgi:hypothetical protein